MLSGARVRDCSGKPGENRRETELFEDLKRKARPAGARPNFIQQHKKRPIRINPIGLTYKSILLTVYLCSKISA